MNAAATAGFALTSAAPGTLGVAGVLDFETAAAALAAIRLALAGHRIQIRQLDLDGVTRSDSAGLACVLAAVAEAGAGLQVIRMPVGMRALAQVCEVDRLLS